jgi:hypothetical protein
MARSAGYRNVNSLPRTTSGGQSMASATLVIYSLPKLGISGDASARGRFVGLPSLPPIFCANRRRHSLLLLPFAASRKSQVP